MYATTGKLVADHGRRAELVEILKQAAKLVGQIPECRLYLVNEDSTQDVNVWVYELWNDKQSHDASLHIAGDGALIAQARPLLAAAPEGTELRFVGGHGVEIP